MNRIKYETYYGAAGYDAVARKKIKELEEKVGTGGGSGGVYIEMIFTEDDEEIITSSVTYSELKAMLESEKLPNGLYVEKEPDGNGGIQVFSVEAITQIRRKPDSNGDLYVQTAANMLVFSADGTIILE